MKFKSILAGVLLALLICQAPVLAAETVVVGAGDVNTGDDAVLGDITVDNLDVTSGGVIDGVGGLALGVDGTTEVTLLPTGKLNFGLNQEISSDAGIPGFFIGHQAGPTVKVFISPRWEIGMHSVTEFGWTAAAAGATLETFFTRESAGVVNLNGSLTLDGSLSAAGGVTFSGISSISGNLTMTDTEPVWFYNCDATGGDVTVTLPTLADNYGDWIEIRRNSAAKNCIFDGEGGETINGQLTMSTAARYDVLSILAGPSEWMIR